MNEILNSAAAKEILTRAIETAKSRGAEHAHASLSGGTESNVRFALNGITTNGVVRGTNLSLSVSIGKRNASVSTNTLEPADIRRAADDAVHYAKILPEDPEWMPPLGPQTYSTVSQWFSETEAAGPDVRARAAGTVTREAKAKKVTSSGFFTTDSAFRSIANSSGLYAYHRSTAANLSATTRTTDGTGSGWASSYSPKVSEVDVAGVAQGSIDRAVRSAEPKALDPGEYPVILEPEAVGNLLGYFNWLMAARSADEGRSFFSKPGGGNKIGEKICDERISLITDPRHPMALGAPWDGSGQPVKKMAWIENGVLKNLRYSRYWAKKKGTAPTPSPTSIVVQGAGKTTSLAEMIAGAKRAVLVTRLWYIRMVDPKQILLTGLTRDGLFLVENGKVTRPLVNFRFNESPIEMLRNIDTFSAPVRTGEGRAMPALSVKKFRFSSISQAV